MKTTTIFGIIFLISATLAFGQSKLGMSMSREAAAQAWATVINLPPDTPGVSGGGLVSVPEFNGTWHQTVWAVYTLPGTYLMRGNTCDGGGEEKLGTAIWETNPYSATGGGVVLNTRKRAESGDFMPSICSIEFIRLHQGITQLSTIQLGQSSDAPELQIGSEGVKDGRYYISTGKLPSDAVVIIGQTGVATEIQPSPAGTIVFFSPNGLPYAVGPTTGTLCYGGKCGTTTYKKKVVVEYPGGKG